MSNSMRIMEGIILRKIPLQWSNYIDANGATAILIHSQSEEKSERLDLKLDAAASRRLNHFFNYLANRVREEDWSQMRQDALYAYWIANHPKIEELEVNG